MINIMCPVSELSIKLAMSVYNTMVQLNKMEEEKRYSAEVFFTFLI